MKEIDDDIKTPWQEPLFGSSLFPGQLYQSHAPQFGMTYHLYRSLEPEKYPGPSTSKASVPPPRMPPTPVPHTSSSKEEPSVHFESKAIFSNEEPTDS